MSDPHSESFLGDAAEHEEPPYDEHEYDEPRPRRRRPLRGCLPVLIALAVIAAGCFFGGRYAYDSLKSHFGSAPDYPGPGTGQVVYQVTSGATSTTIARQLKDDGVVKSIDAFVQAARENDKASSIQVGYYSLKKQMKASEALAVLVDPKNMMQSVVVVPEGARVRQVVAAIVAKTDITKKALTQALKNPSAIGLPAAAKGNPEGYLGPATYQVPPHTTAVALLKQMVAKQAQVVQSLQVATKGRALGLTTEQVLTVASILEYEANRQVDYPKVARVLYNRIKQGMPLQLDSTVSYVSGRSGDVWTTDAERADNSLYNTYQHAGLPPGPIGSPGAATITAALNPAQGNWLFFLPDFEHGTTLYYDHDGPQRQADLARIKAWCAKTQKC